MIRLVMGLLLVFALMTGGVLAQDAEATTEPTAESDTAYVRVANFAPSADAVDIGVNAEGADFSGTSFQQISDWTAVPAGTYTVSAGEASADVALGVDTWTTLAVVESSEAEGALTIQPIPEVYDGITPGTAGFTVVHAANGTPALNMLRDGVVFVSGLDYLGFPEQPAFASIPVDSGIYDISFEEPEEPGTALVDLSQTEFPENAHVLIAVVHDGGQPRALVDVTTPAEAALVRGDLEAPGTILEAAQANENLAGLGAALNQAGLAEQFGGEGPFTVFAPADFVMDDATADGEALADLLRAHTVEGEMTLQEIIEAQSLTTLAGSDLAVTVEGDSIFVNGAQLIEANIPATNGVIHMVNGLLTGRAGS